MPPADGDGELWSAKTTRGDARRTQILKVAAGLFADRGYSAVSINDIGAAAGISGPGIYRYFGSKEELLVAIYRDLRDRDRDGVAAACAGDPDAVGALAGLVQHQLELATQEWEKIRIFSSESRHLPTDSQEVLRAENRVSFDIWRGQLRRARPDLSVEEADVTVHGALALINSLSLARAPEQCSPRVRHHVERLAMGVLLSGSHVDASGSQC